MVERHLAKVEVAGSSPVIRSSRNSTRNRVLFYFYWEDFGEVFRQAFTLALKTLIKCFLNELRNPLQKKTVPIWYGFFFC